MRDSKSQEHEIWELAQMGKIKKMICGAAVRNKSDVERTAFIATKVEQHIVDVSGTDPEIVSAAVRGRSKAMGSASGRFPLIMASITPLPGDVHFQKASFGPGCSYCGNCGKVCPNQAIAAKDDSITFHHDSCRGCGHCIEVCPTGNISLSPLDVPPLETAIEACLTAGADAIELHVSGYCATDVEGILDSSAKPFDSTVLSICIGSQRSSPKEIIEVVDVIGKVRKGIWTFIQADGSTMAGSVHGLSALATAEVILSRRFPNIFVICSGGCSAVTWKIARLAQLPIAGVGSGITLRERLHYLAKRPDLFQNESVWRKAREICREISEGSDDELRATRSIARDRILGTALNRIGNSFHHQRRNV